MVPQPKRKWIAIALHAVAFFLVIRGAMWFSEKAPEETNIPLGWLSVALGIGATFAACYVGVQGTNREVASRIGRALLGQFIVWFCAFFAYPIIQGARPASDTAFCLSNIRLLGTAMQIYTADFDDCFPPSNRWSEGLAEYLGTNSEGIRITPDSFNCPLALTRYGYAMNRSLASISTDKIEAPEATILLFEVESSVPSPNGGPDSTVYRHNCKCTVNLVSGEARKMDRATIMASKWK